MICEKCRKSIPLTKNLAKLCDQWQQILSFFGASRSVFDWEAAEIGRAVQIYGAEAINLAFLGVKTEKKTERFDPAQYLSLKRVFDPLKIQRFINLGTQYRTKLLAERFKNDIRTKGHN